MIFKEEGVIAVLQIILEVVPRLHFRQYRLQDLVVVGQKLVERISIKLLVGLQIDVFAERKAMEYVHTTNRSQLWSVLFLISIYRSCSIDYAEVGVFMITLTQLFAPLWEFKGLVDEQYLSTLGHEAPSKVDNTMCLKVKAIEIDV